MEEKHNIFYFSYYSKNVQVSGDSYYPQIVFPGQYIYWKNLYMKEKIVF